MKTHEIRVRAVTRYIVTEFESEEHEGGRGSAGSQCLAESDNLRQANEIAKAFHALKPEARCFVLPTTDLRPAITALEQRLDGARIVQGVVAEGLAHRADMTAEDDLASLDQEVLGLESAISVLSNRD